MYSDIVKYIQSLYGSTDFIPLHAPVFIGNEKKYLTECIDTTFVSSIGKFVDRFELDVAEYTGASKVVVCVNGTEALHIAMLLNGVKKEDEILTQALTFIATCNAISYIGAHPVFLDIDKETLGLSPQAVREWLKENAVIKSGECYNKKTARRIKACIPMHTFGHPMLIEDLLNVCDEYNIDVIEDAAESLGSFYKNKHTGTFGKIGTLSFNGNKIITTGGGGMLLFQDEDLAQKAKHLTTQAKLPNRWEFVHDEIGYNYRMPNINAALGCAQMENLERFITDKRETASLYKKYFNSMDGVQFFTEPDQCTSNYWLNTLIFENIPDQQDFLEYSNNHGVMTRPAWRLMNKLEMFKHCQTDHLQNTEWMASRIVNIPSSVRIK